MVKRRDFVRGAGLTAFAGLIESAGLLIAPSQSLAQEVPKAQDAMTFSRDGVALMARALASKPFKASSNSLPDPYSALSFEQYVGIKVRPEGMLFSRDNLGFVIEPLHRGFIFTQPVDLFVVDNGTATHVVYDPAGFEFGKLTPPAAGSNLGFSGIRILWQHEGETPIDVALFQGASFFRAVALGQTPGLISRVMAIRTADPQGEEFPIIRTLWIERPVPASGLLVLHALLDSQSAAGACHFTIRPGDATIVDVEITLYPRVDIDHLGVAPMTGSYLYGPIDHRRDDEVRSGVYEVSGLQMLTGSGEWLWRSVANRHTLQISAFLDNNPKGFGFLQRDRSLENFQDDIQHWERRPSLWIEPLSDWGEGAVTLVEIPSESEINDNIVAYWRPKAPLKANSEVMLAYRQFWCWTPNEHPRLATVSTVRSGHVGQGTIRRFLVEFSGEIFADAAATAEIHPKLTAQPGNIQTLRSYWYQDRNLYRVVFDIDPGGESASELRLQLETANRPVSESWLYRWTG